MTLIVLTGEVDISPDRGGFSGSLKSLDFTMDTFLGEVQVVTKDYDIIEKRNRIKGRIEVWGEQGRERGPDTKPYRDYGFLLAHKIKMKKYGEVIGDLDFPGSRSR